MICYLLFYRYTKLGVNYHFKKHYPGECRFFNDSKFLILNDVAVISDDKNNASKYLFFQSLFLSFLERLLPLLLGGLLLVDGNDVTEVIRPPLSNGLVDHEKITELFYDHGDLISGSSVAHIHSGQLLVGSVIDKLVVCDLYGKVAGKKGGNI
ncbi:serum paraoxonase/arylesterase 1 [Plakobranchus ocellatus]|uniref:Serum paraoxonase/arylesterase 1 n=1 Tax=Plakobranchus ocellatus TaxID=259542 RepID=A0AAV3YVX4_9GAST|nr:serum paraoxonase/arylesterase 1 [Plakobranchus ocellatus]